MKCHCVFIPNGLLANIYIPSVAQNGKGGINISGLEEERQWLLMPYRLTNGTLPVLYGDNIYTPSTVIVQLNGVNNIFNLHMISTRIDIKYKFGLTASLFKTNKCKEYMEANANRWSCN